MPPKRKLSRSLPKKQVIKLVVKTRLEKDGTSADRAVAGLEALLAGEALDDLMREVIAATLVKAYTERFHLKQGIMAKLFKADNNLTQKQRQHYYKQFIAYGKAKDALAKQYGTDDERYYAAAAKATRYQNAYLGHKLPRPPSDYKQRDVTLGDGTVLKDVTREARLKLLSGGAFRERMLQVLDRFTNTAHMRKVERKTSHTVYFGNTNYMGQIATNEHSESDVNVMWRQLEYGSGRFAKKAGNIPLPRMSEHKWLRGADKHYRRLTDGSWVLGSQADGGGLHILGSYPGNWLRDQSGAQYEGDALRFEAVFRARLAAALKRGR